MKKSLIEHLESITDYRKQENIKHKLIDILVISILGVLCGADYYTEIESFANGRKKWLSAFLELPNGIPSHDTFGEVISKIDAEELHKAFIEWVKSINELIDSEVIAIDGKTARRTKDNVNNKKPLHVLSAWASEAGLSIGQIKVDEKTNEINAIPELLKLLEVKGCIITIDAMGTQKNIAEKIVESDADYILSLKENQKTLYDDVELYMKHEILTQNKKELAENGLYYTTYDQDHED